MPERRIVVGVEGSGYARAALIWALEEAAFRDTVVEVATAYSPTYVPAAPDLGYVPLDSFDLITEIERMQGDVIESAVEAAGHPDVEVRRTLVKGRAADTLMRIAEGAEMLVVGNRGRGGFAGLRLGSVSQAIAHHSPLPACDRPHRPRRRHRRRRRRRRRLTASTGRKKSSPRLALVANLREPTVNPSDPPESNRRGTHDRDLGGHRSRRRRRRRRFGNELRAGR